ncbi:MFS general substrate transporter [Myriangium duriaei CBS 260.36]|uniref:MFS general substrate transporter n=1 Tax=Myriangium duriaei CBS 260.36 TaxID=1168546 RepID=A0A9P4MI55_9PEZI|nr:MFS general substrate transporter [Myriangium duriaei CBS 260.36]
MATIALQDLSARNVAHDQPPARSWTFVLSNRSSPGWAVLLAAFSITFVAVGIPNSFGVFQDYYERVLFSTIPSSQIILIGSLASSLYMILGILAGRVADVIGYQWTLTIGSFLIVTSLFAASVLSTFYGLLLSQGFTFGVGAAFVYYPAVTVSRGYFRRHGLANGFVVSGGALGGCVLPYSTRVLLQNNGLQSTFRVLGFLAAGVLAFASCVFLGVHRPATRAQRHGFWAIARELLVDVRFLIILTTGSIAMTGFLPRYFLITPSAVGKGIDSGYAAWLVGIMNGLSILGRLGIGSFADRYGKLKALVVSFVLCGAAHLMFWLPAVLVGGERTTALMTVFVVFVGLLGSGFVSLIPVVIADIFGAEDLASKVGLLNSVMGIGVLAGPSAVYAIVSDGDYSVAVVASGLLMLVGGLLLTGTFRYL